MEGLAVEVEETKRGYGPDCVQFDMYGPTAWEAIGAYGKENGGDYELQPWLQPRCDAPYPWYDLSEMPWVQWKGGCDAGTGA